MSSKVCRPEDTFEVAAFSWRQVGPGAPAGAAPDPAARVREMERDWERRAKEAWQAGYAEGAASGRREAEAKAAAAVEQLGQAIREIQALRPRLRREAGEDLLRLSLAIARRILHRELALDPEALLGIIHAAFTRIDDKENVKVRIHPSHAAALQAYVARSGLRVEVQADAGLAPGGLVFETARGDLDASIDTQLREIGRGLADHVRIQE